MVVVSRTGDDTIGLERRSRFENLLGNMKIDEVMRQHVYMCSYGFYHYEDCHGPSAASFDSGTRSFFFGNFLFSVVWSFDLGTGKTSAVLILRIIERHYNGVLPLKVLESSLQAYKDRLNSPLSLAFVLHTTLTHVLEDNLWRILTALRSIERDTKHGPSSCDFTGYRDESIPYGRQASQQKEKKEHVGRQDTGMQQLDDNESHIEDLTKVAQRLADVNVHLANVDRHAKLLKFMTNTLKDESFRKSYCKSDGNGGHTDCAEDTEYFVATLPSLGRRLDAIQPTIEYLQGRAKGQHQVVFGLLTHEDAMVNLRVARANVGIARAARDDSSAMRTIALMTMIFLPATFYAALFDQPTLNWEPTRPGVIQDGFALYWALTVPSTLVVLATSWVMHRGWRVLGEKRGKDAERRWADFKKKIQEGRVGGERTEKIAENGCVKDSLV
ncbi:hypothetical protein VUR80DRAFT_10039 [Thermomyces stellatus]